jgi:uncharacterized protein (DUF488 family)
MKLFTIGVTAWNQRDFFDALSGHGIKRVVDVRRRAAARGAEHAFGNKARLERGLAELGITYVQVKELAPQEQLWKTWYAKLRGGANPAEIWGAHKARFLKQSETVECVDSSAKSDFRAPTCLVCTCRSHEFCHRLIVAEMFAHKWPDTKIVHLKP